MVRRLYEQGLQREEVINLLAFIDWMLTLPLELEREFRREVEQIEKERQMLYVTSFERIGIEKGIEQGTKGGLIKGISLGLQLKFGESGTSLLPEIEQITDVGILSRVLDAMSNDKPRCVYATVDTVEQLRQVHQTINE